MPRDRIALAEEIMRRNEALKSERQTWESTWRQLSDYIQPRKNQINVKVTSPDASQSADLFDTTAVDSNLVLGAGQLQYITPASERWAGYEAPEALRRNGPATAKAQKWYQDCSEVVMRELARSNFYTEVHEFYLDRGGVGTACLYVAEGKKTTITTCCHPIGSYCIAEDDEGTVDTVFREFELTVRQAVQKFGLDVLGEKLKTAAKDPEAKQLDKKFKFIHAVYPRSDDQRERGKQDGPNKPIASVYVCIEDKHVLRDEGFDEMAFMASRYLTWGEEVYGWCPSIDALGTIKQVNFIEKQMDALAEVAAFPRVLIPESLEGAVDLRAGGLTTFDPNAPNAIPKEWATQGRYDIGQERVKSKQEAIRKAYHNDLFNMLAMQTQQMTAFETMQRIAEKLVLFSPTFARLTTEFLNPFLQRVFGICFRAGKFSDPPPDVYINTGQGVELAAPEVVFTSKVALAIKALQNHSFVEFMGIIGPLVQLRPDTLDNLNVDKVFNDLMRNLSLPTDWTVDEEVRDTIRTQRAQQEQAAAAIGAAQGIAKAGADMGKAPPAMREMVMSGRS